jgi:dynein heavy chain
MWDNLTELTKIEGFDGLSESFEKNHREWREWYILKEPERKPMIGNWDDRLNDFQKLLLVRCLRLDRVIFSISNFVMKSLGKEFVEPPVLDLGEVFEKSQNNIPLIFILSPGVDPTTGLLQLAFKEKMKSKFKTLSLGQGQSTIAAQLISAGMKAGHWVFLANCHLSLSWMSDLEQIVETIQYGKVHKKFRLWLSSSPHPDFPISILQNSTKITTEPPSGIKSNMKRLYGLLSNEKFEACGAREKYQKLLFALSFFNAILIERRKFGQLGWNSTYFFNDGDFEASESILSNYLDEYEETPWVALKYLIAEISYGGHITDSFDKRLLVTYSANVFNNNVLIVPNYQLSESGEYFIPNEGNLESTKEFIEILPNTDHPDVFGQNQNAEIASLINESRGIFKNLLLMQSDASGSDSGENREEAVYQIAKDILSALPKPLNYEEIKKKFGRNLSPLEIVLLQEIERYNRLLRLMAADLSILLRCIKGLSILTPNIDIVLVSLSVGMVPASWLKSEVIFCGLENVRLYFLFSSSLPIPEATRFLDSRLVPENRVFRIVGHQKGAQNILAVCLHFPSELPDSSFAKGCSFTETSN